MEINFDEVIMAHSKWKTHLRQMVDGVSKEKIDIASLGKDDHCEFGKWISAERHNFKDNADFKEMVAAHAEFHKKAAEMATKIESGHRLEVKKELDSMSGPFIAASSKVINLISKLRSQLGK